jgi:hypothetical protein
LVDSVDGCGEPRAKAISVVKRSSTALTLLFAGAMVLPVGLAAVQAGAGPPPTDTTCRTVTGTASFSPTLPKWGSNAQVSGTLIAVGTVGRCAGGGVTGGTITLKAVTPLLNCTTFLGTLPHSEGQPMNAAETIKWDTKRTSALTIRFGAEGNGRAIILAKGVVSHGAFAGRYEMANLVYKLATPGACKGAGLKSIKIIAGSLMVR